MTATSTPRIQINVAKYRADIQRFKKETGLDASVFFREMFRMLLELCYHYTAPPSKGRGATAGSARNRGKGRVRADILKTTRTVSLGYLTFLQDITGSSYISQVVLNKKGGTSTYTLTNITLNRYGDQSVMDRYHQRRRSKHDGAVPGKHHSLFADKMYSHERAVETYIDDSQRKVGKLKSGWALPLRRAGSNLPQGWVLAAGRIAGASGVAPYGSYAERVHEGEFRGSYMGQNNVSYFKDPDGMIARAHHIQERAAETKLELWVQQQIDKYNKRAKESAK